MHESAGIAALPAIESEAVIVEGGPVSIQSAPAGPQDRDVLGSEVQHLSQLGFLFAEFLFRVFPSSDPSEGDRVLQRPLYFPAL